MQWSASATAVARKSIRSSALVLPRKRPGRLRRRWECHAHVERRLTGEPDRQIQLLHLGGGAGTGGGSAIIPRDAALHRRRGVHDLRKHYLPPPAVPTGDAAARPRAVHPPAKAANGQRDPPDCFSQPQEFLSNRLRPTSPVVARGANFRILAKKVSGAQGLTMNSSAPAARQGSRY